MKQSAEQLRPSSRAGLGFESEPEVAAPEDSSGRAVLLLSLGAGLGLLLAAFSLLDSGSRGESGLPPGAVASVNGQLIRRDDYQRLLSGLESDSRNPIDDKARQHVLNRMIEEELLVQRAVELGLVQLDRRVRADLTSNLISSVVNSTENQEPEPAELAKFYAEQSDFFTQPGRYRVNQIYFRLPADAQEDAVVARAERARAEFIAGTDLDAISRRLGDQPISPLPNSLLPALKLREYLGPAAMRAAVELPTGEISQPVRSGIGIHLLVMMDRVEARTPALPEIEPQVRSEWRRRSGDRALRRYLNELRAQSETLTSPQL